RSGKNAHLGAFAQPAQPLGLFIGLMNVVQDCNPHALPRNQIFRHRLSLPPRRRAGRGQRLEGPGTCSCGHYGRARSTGLRLKAANSSIVARMQPAIISISGLSKTYASGFRALSNIDLEIRPGEIFALLGPNGAGKTTLISIVCGIVNASAGRVLVDGHDIAREWRATRSLIGLVPQELTTEAFETVWNTVSFSRGLFGKAPNPTHIEKVLKDLSLWDKKDNKIITLSGGMKRRLLIAKALSHEPRVLFLDEPTAGVDVTLRQEMWQLVRS